MRRLPPPVVQWARNRLNSNTSTVSATSDADENLSLPLPLPATPPPTAMKIKMCQRSCKCANKEKGNGYCSVGVGAPLPHSTSTGKSHRLSPSLSFLEHLTVEISSIHSTTLLGGKSARAAGGSGSKQFAMTVHHSKTKASWRHCHSYDDYKRLHERVLDLMEQGHFCMAECPWLYTFLVRSFPKSSPLFTLGLVSERAMEERRFALARTLATLQSVLLNPGNHSCELLTHGVATELVAFLYGENMSSYEQPATFTTGYTNHHATASLSPALPPSHPWEISSPVATHTRGFSVSLSSSDRGSAGSNQDQEEPEAHQTEQDQEPQQPSTCCSVCEQPPSSPGRRHFSSHVVATWTAKSRARSTSGSSTKKWRTSSADTTMEDEATPREATSDSFTMLMIAAPKTPPGSPPPMIPEHAVYSPPRSYHSVKPSAKKFSIGATTANMLHTIRQRVRSPSTGSSFIM